MKTVQLQLLESLGRGVRPVDLGEPAGHPVDRFEGMLDDAVHGRARTELGVTFGPSASGVFDFAQQEQIARAVDIAAAAGSERALILHERHALRVDVRNRVVLEAPETQQRLLISDIDAFVCASSSDPDAETIDQQADPSGLIIPARVVRNASLARTLAQADAAAGT